MLNVQKTIAINYDYYNKITKWGYSFGIRKCQGGITAPPGF